jgi:hypothetical protein
LFLRELTEERSNYSSADTRVKGARGKTPGLGRKPAPMA